MEKGEAIPFILIDQSINSQKQAQYTFKIHPRANQIFNSEAVKNKKVAIAAVAGPQRTGKSFLSNRLLKRMKGFAIGPTTMPCTKGLWIWGEPIKISEDTVLIIMDTEGLNSVQRDINVDMKIFSLSILLSSVFIYNSIGHIDQKALENMSYVLRISQNIKVSADNQEEAEISKYFPYFYWVLRDFSLDLKGKSESQYLENSLRPVNNDQKDPRNQIRTKIKKLFQHRRCECFPRPVHQENRLAHIQDLQYDELRQSFRQKMRMFVNTFFSNLPPKTINNKPITGGIYLNLAYEYVNAMNSGKIPKIMNSLEGVIAAQVRKICQSYKNIYKNAMDDVTKHQKLPIDQGQIQGQYRKYLSMIQQKFDEKFKHWGDIKMVQDSKNKFYEQLAKDLKSRLKENNRMSEIAANKNLQKIFQSFKPPQLSGIGDLTASFVSEKQQQFMEKYKQYDSKNKAPAKYTVFANKFPQLIFDFFGLLIARIKGICSEQLKNAQYKVNQAKRQIQSLKRIKERQQDLIQQKQRETAGLIFEKDKIARELKKNEQLVHFANETGKMSKKDKKNELQKLKTQYLELQNYNEEVLSLNERLKQQILILKQKKQTVREIPTQNLQNSPQDSEYVPANLPHDLVTTLMNLRSQLSIMNQFYDKKAKDETIDQYMDRELQEIRAHKFQEIQKLKDQYRSKAQSMRLKIQKNKEMYQRQLQMMNKHLDDIKKQNIDLIKRQNQNPGSDSKMKILIAQRKKFQQSLRLKQNHLNSQLAISSERQKQIGLLKQQMHAIEDQFAFVSAEKANLESFKEQFWYLLRESLNSVTGKANKLKHAQNKLNPQDQKSLKNILNSYGIKL